MPALSPEHEGVLNQLPAATQKQIEQALREDRAVAPALVVLLDEIARLKGITAPKATVSSSTFATTYQVSQILPARRSVRIGFAKTGFATFEPASGDVLESGDWTTYNVLLKLPVPKRPKPQWNVVLAKLGGAGPFLVFSTNEADPPATREAARFAKYKDLDVGLSRAVAAYVGAREGVLYLLDDFVFFGFKKPLTMVLLAEIESISFTVVTSRTFNIVVQLLDEQSYEFEKISHDFYEAINVYITEHRLNDESMAEARRAKKQKTEPTALEQATKELQAVSRSEDEEDALEEDFVDAGSPAESESDSDATPAASGDDDEGDEVDEGDGDGDAAGENSDEDDEDDDDDDDDDAAAESNDDSEARLDTEPL